jgi:hypothetical protein
VAVVAVVVAVVRVAVVVRVAAAAVSAGNSALASPEKPGAKRRVFYLPFEEYHAMHTGSCLCGDVKFEIEGRLEPIQVCHCQQCRKAQGTPFSTNISVSTQDFKILSGARSLTRYESSPGMVRYFCTRCGSPIYGAKDTDPDIYRVRAGTINELLSVRPVADFFNASKCNWWPITDDLPQFPDAYVSHRKGRA